MTCRVSPDAWGPARRSDAAATGALVADSGAATLLAVAVMLLTVVAGAVSVGLGELVAARAQASSAADLAALAGAAAIGEGPAPACGAARRAAARNDTTLITCDVTGFDVEVTVRRRAPSIIRAAAHIGGRSAPELTVSARAGQRDDIVARSG